MIAKSTRLLCFVLAVLMLAPLAACAEENVGSMSVPALKTVPQEAVVNANQEGFFCLSLSEIVKIPSPVTAAQLTNDQKKAVCVTPEGELLIYEFDADTASFGSSFVISSAPVYKLSCLADSGFIWRDTEGSWFRYLFDEHLITEIGVVNAIHTSTENTVSAVFAKDGKFFLLSGQDTEAIELGAYLGLPVVWHVSADGSAVVCADSLDAEYRVTAFFNRNISYEASFSKDQYYDSYNTMREDTVLFVPGGDYFILWSPNDSRVDFVSRDGLVRRNLIEDQEIYRVFCLAGKDLSAADVSDPLYVITKNEDSRKSLFCITPSGESLPMAEEMEEAVVVDGRLYFVDQKNRLMSAEIKGDRISSAKKIDTGVVTIYDSDHFLYYVNKVKERREKTAFGRLFAYSTVSGKKTMITRHAEMINTFSPGDWDNYYLRFWKQGGVMFICADRKRVAHLDEAVTLFVFSEDEQKNYKVGKDIMWWRFKRHVTADGESLYTYARYVGDYSLDPQSYYDVWVDWYLFDGEESVLITENGLA